LSDVDLVISRGRVVFPDGVVQADVAAIGSDADFAVVDLERERVVTPEYMQSAAGWGLYDGWNLKGWPVTTIVRGEAVMQDGQIVGSPSHGTYVARHPD
jgi:dihydropyrimidinase